MHKEDYVDSFKNTKVVDWFAIIGVIAGAAAANLVNWGIASINGMVIAAIFYCVGQAVQKK